MWGGGGRRLSQGCRGIAGAKEWGQRVTGVLEGVAAGAAYNGLGRSVYHDDR